LAPWAGMRCPVRAANSARQGSLHPAGWVRRPRFPHLAFGPHPSRQRLRIRLFASGHLPKRRSERRSARRPGSATHGYRRTGSETDGAGGRAATVAGYAGPGFHTWPLGHIPQDNGSETACSHPVTCPKDVRRGVRRRDRGQRPTATKDPAPKPTARAAEPPL